MSVQQQRVQAEKLKDEGKVLFQKQKYKAATEKYTEAICMAPDWDVLLVNRANCYSKLGSYDNTLDDCKKAISLNGSNYKAYYFLGIASIKRFETKQGIQSLEKALELARAQDASIKDSIWQLLAQTKFEQWQQTSKMEQQELDKLKSDLQSDPPQSGTTLLMQLIKQKEQELQIGEVDSAFCCPLTMMVFRDPVVTPEGNSYERSALLDHLRKVGRFEPVSRKPLREDQLYPNVQLRSAVMCYLAEHPWAWGECC